MLSLLTVLVFVFFFTIAIVLFWKFRSKNYKDYIKYNKEFQEDLEEIKKVEEFTKIKGDSFQQISSEIQEIMIKDYDSQKLSEMFVEGKGGVVRNVLDTFQSAVASLPKPLPVITFATYSGFIEGVAQLEEYFRKHLRTPNSRIKIPETDVEIMVFKDWVVLYLLVKFYQVHGSKTEESENLQEDFIKKYHITEGKTKAHNIRTIIGEVVFNLVKNKYIRSLEDIQEYERDSLQFVEKVQNLDAEIRKEVSRKQKFTEDEKMFFKFTEQLELLATRARKNTIFNAAIKLIGGDCALGSCEYKEDIPFEKYEDLSTESQWKQHAKNLDDYYSNSEIKSWNQVADWFIQYLIVRYFLSAPATVSCSNFLDMYKFPNTLSAEQFRNEVKDKLGDIFARKIPKQKEQLVELVRDPSMDKLQHLTFSQFRAVLRVIAEEISTNAARPYRMWSDELNSSTHREYFDEEVLENPKNVDQLTDWLIHYMIIEYNKSESNLNVLKFVLTFATKEYIKPDEFRRYVSTQINIMINKGLFEKFSRLEAFIHILLKNDSENTMNLSHIQTYTRRESVKRMSLKDQPAKPESVKRVSLKDQPVKHEFDELLAEVYKSIKRRNSPGWIWSGYTPDLPQIALHNKNEDLMLLKQFYTANKLDARGATAMVNDWMLIYSLVLFYFGEFGSTEQFKEAFCKKNSLELNDAISAKINTKEKTYSQMCKVFSETLNITELQAKCYMSSSP